MSVKLINPEKALIFRIIHRDNVPWILDHGLHCRNSDSLDPNYRNIGNPELIALRGDRRVTIPPGGTFSDYIPFYFTPHSIMLFNIKTGCGGITKYPNEEIVILVTSLLNLQERGVCFVFTDRHAFLRGARFFSGLADLDRIDWPILQKRSFNYDPNDLGKKERYQAEAMIHRHLPVDALLGMACYNGTVGTWLGSQLADRGVGLKVTVQPGWYF